MGRWNFGNHPTLQSVDNNPGMRLWLIGSWLLMDAWRFVGCAVLAVLGGVLQTQSASANLSFDVKTFDGGKFVVVSGTFDYADRLDDFSRLVRENGPRFVTFQSPGGNVWKAMELGRLIRQSALDTLQIRSLECESACAFAFMGGVKRFADPGAIGMHRASLQDSSSVDVDSAVSSIQALTATEIAYLNDMGVDPALLQVALNYSSDDIRYLSGSEMEQYRVVTNSGASPSVASAAANTPPAVGGGDASLETPRADWKSSGEWIQIFSRQVLSDALDLAATFQKTINNTRVFKYDNGWFVGAIGPFASGTANPERDRLVGSGLIPKDSVVVTGNHFVGLVGAQTAVVPTQQSGMDATARAIAAAQMFERSWSLPNQQALDFLDTLYAAQIAYFGKPTSKESVMQEKAAFAARWPSRTYVIEPNTARASCTPSELCTVEGIVDWQVSSTARNATSTGSASFELVFAMGDPLKLVSESSSVLTRQTTNGSR